MRREVPFAYRALLLLFPRRFRREFGKQMEDLFARMLRDRAPTRAVRARLWTKAITDIVVHAGVERMIQFRSVLSRSPEPRRPRRHRAAIAQDIRYALRGFVRSPGYTAAFVVTLGLGIGANTAIFSVINGVLLRPLPHDDGDAIVHLAQPVTMSGFDFNASFSIPEITDYRDQSSTLEGFAQYSSMTFTLLGYGEPQRVSTAVVSGDFFQVMGLRAVLGRTLDGRDDGAAVDAVAVLSHEFWSGTFGADSTVLGTTVEMNDRTVTVVGVLEPVPPYPNEEAIYVNLASSPHHLGATMNHNRTHRMTDVFARLRPGVTLSVAQAELEEIAARLHETYPEAYPADQRFRIEATSLRAALTRDARPTLLMIMGAAGFVLIIACANVANLTLTRLVRRERELAVRSALGAGITRLRGQLLIENLLLSLTGAALGVAVAAVGLDLLIAFAARHTPLAAGIGLDGTVLLFTMAVATGAAFLFAWGPGLLMLRDLSTSLGESGGRVSASLARRRVQRGLVVTQLAVSFMLLIGASLLVRTLINLSQIDPGYDPQNVLTMAVPNMPDRSDAASRIAFFDEAILRIQNHPAVRSAAVAMVTPLRNSPMNHNLRIEGRDLLPGQAAPNADFRSVSPDYFHTVGIPLVRGRTFATTDHADAPGVVILSQSMADHYFANQNPVGRRLAWDWGSMRMGGNEQDWKTIVGVVADTRDYGLDQAAMHTVFQPYAQEPWGNGLLVRTVGEPETITRDVIKILRELDPNQPVEHVATMEQLKSEWIAPRRLNATLFTAFALLALIIAAIGVSGVLAFSVSQRQHEFGIRLTLGAERGTVLRMVLKEGATLAGIGLALGATGALLLSRFLSGWLFEVEPNDPVTYAAVAAALLLVAVGASVVPARRATHVDPVDALRAE
ncbi:MAG: ABC transporter permease [Gemmatimonadetes bacterium]|nr:ABC transporter permease [Gemmatimonadota bacterium]